MLTSDKKTIHKAMNTWGFGADVTLYTEYPDGTKQWTDFSIAEARNTARELIQSALEAEAIQNSYIDAEIGHSLLMALFESVGMPVDMFRP